MTTRDEDLAAARDLIARAARFNDEQLAQVIDRWRDTSGQLWQRVREAEAGERAAMLAERRAENRAARAENRAARAEAEQEALRMELQHYKSQSWPLVCEICGVNDDVTLSRPPLPGDLCFEHSPAEGGAE